MSPRGRIVFASGNGTDFDIWRLDLDQHQLTQLTHGTALNDYPRWSPDGQRIAFISTGHDGVPSLWVMNGDGSDQQRITEGIYCQAPVWAPDGKTILFIGNVTRREDLDLCIIDPQSPGTPAVLLERPGVESSPSWSPDGARIAFAAKPVEAAFKGGMTAIFEMHLSTRKVQQLTPDGSRHYGPAYSPNGTEIAFISHRDSDEDAAYQRKVADLQAAVKNGDESTFTRLVREVQSLTQGGDIWIMGRDGSNPFPLTRELGVNAGVTWSLCGSYIAFTSTRRTGSAAHRLRIVETTSGQEAPFHYDRAPLEQEIGSLERLNGSTFQQLIPDFLERLFADRSFWGEERHPDWAC